MRLIAVFAFAATLWGGDVHVRISSDSEDAASELLLRLNEHGRARDLHFVSEESARAADFTLVVSWFRESALRVPMAQVQVFDAGNTPLYTVWKRGAFTRTSAVNRCARALVGDFAQRTRPPAP